MINKMDNKEFAVEKSDESKNHIWFLASLMISSFTIFGLYIIRYIFIVIMKPEYFEKFDITAFTVSVLFLLGSMVFLLQAESEENKKDENDDEK